MFNLVGYLTVLLALLATTGGAALMTWCSVSRDKRQRHASDLWRSIRLRNGVTEPLPWHSPTSQVNAPGLVEVSPRYVQNQPPLHPWELAPVTVSEARPLLASTNTENPYRTSVRPGSELVNEPPEPRLELTDPPHPSEKARVQRLFKAGKSQTLIIRNVWGLSRGGGKKYTEARRRYREYVKPLVHPMLRLLWDREDGVTNA